MSTAVASPSFSSSSNQPTKGQSQGNSNSSSTNTAKTQPEDNLLDHRESSVVGSNPPQRTGSTKDDDPTTEDSSSAPAEPLGLQETTTQDALRLPKEEVDDNPETDTQILQAALRNSCEAVITQPDRNSENSPLPTDMYHILRQVAHTGSCHFLFWNEPASGTRTSVQQSALFRRQHHRNRKRNNAYNNNHNKYSIHTTTNTTMTSKRTRISRMTSSRTTTTTYEWDESTTTSSHYDSEGTTTTTNSELSLDYYRRKQALLQIDELNRCSNNNPFFRNPTRYKCLRDVFHGAIEIVLDDYFERKGGYKLSPAEKRRFEKPEMNPNSSTEYRITAQDIFSQRKARLLKLMDAKDTSQHTSTGTGTDPETTGPPFTIQRIAEVLVAPGRCYTQTHKLCNCLEKLLLIKASTGAFGGSNGGDSLQNQLEERELAALADERGRVNSEYYRRNKRRASSFSEDPNLSLGSDDVKMNGTDRHDDDDDDRNNDASEKEKLEAAARASLRTKFDHIGNEHLAPATSDRDVRALAESRGMTNSPPPPSLSLGAAGAPGIGIPGHSSLLHPGNGHTDQDHPQSLARVPSPILFSTANEAPGGPHVSGLNAGTSNMQLLQMNHANALSGVSAFELMNPQSIPTGHFLREGDLESRSSGASSDTESDVSFDDSASDRSDGSDYEPFSAARAMALTRIQQQQQRRLLQYGEGHRPASDSEYQSGDSVDSIRAEEYSGESDSSSSDVAD